jgi:hypothetical protein
MNKQVKIAAQKYTNKHDWRGMSYEHYSDSDIENAFIAGVNWIKEKRYTEEGIMINSEDFYCHDDCIGEGRCEKQCSWCINYIDEQIELEARKWWC